MTVAMNDESGHSRRAVLNVNEVTADAPSARNRGYDVATSPWRFHSFPRLASFAFIRLYSGLAWVSLSAVRTCGCRPYWVSYPVI